MRKQYIIRVIIIMLGFGASAQHKDYSGKMHITPLSVEQKGDSVYVSINFDIAGVNVDSQKSISLIPALVSSDNSVDLPEVVVKGKINYNVYKREISLMSKRQKEAYSKDMPYAVLGAYKSSNSRKIGYKVAIKYEPWMADAKLDIYEDLCGCGKPARRMGVSQLVNLITLEKIKPVGDYNITPHLAYIKPEVEEVKLRKVKSDIFLDFIVGQTGIRTDYMNNPVELKKITALIRDIQSDKSAVVKSISVTGYASPEGALANNQRLSEGRAEALVAYLLPRLDYPESMYDIKFGGENWDGLEQCVKSSQMPYRLQVLDILENVPSEINSLTNTSRKKALMDLKGGEPYRYMLHEFFPSLRKAVCNVDFEVQNFDLEKAREVIKIRPQNLSLNEIFLVASAYDRNSHDFIDLFETAVRLYPEDLTANLNAASASLQRKDIISAEKYINRIEGKASSAEYYNTRGVLLMLKGEYDKAKEFLNKAYLQGLSEAKLNLDEINKKLIEINKINE